MQNDELEMRRASLSNQGQTWKNLTDSVTFKKPAPLFDQPMEISIKLLRGLRMVDETVVVHGKLNESISTKGD